MHFSISRFVIALICFGLTLAVDDAPAQSPGLFIPPIEEIAPNYDTAPWSKNISQASRPPVGVSRKPQAKAAVVEKPQAAVTPKQGAPRQRIVPAASPAEALWRLVPTPWAVGLLAVMSFSAVSGVLIYFVRRRSSLPPASRSLVVGLVQSQVRRPRIAIPVAIEQGVSKRRAA